MNVREFTEWLKGFHDQEAIVQIVAHEQGHGYYDQGGNASEEPFDPEKHVDYTDMRGNQFVKPTDSYFNSRTVTFGLYRG